MKRKSYLNKIYGFEKVISASVIKHICLYSSDFIKVVEAHMTFEAGVRKQKQQVFHLPLPSFLFFSCPFYFHSLALLLISLTFHFVGVG